MNELTKRANTKSSSILMEVVCAALVIALIVDGYLYATV